LWVTFEEGTSAAWLYDLLKPHVTKVVVCDPRKNALLKAGNKNDRVDARKLSDLLRAGLLTPVYHGESGVRTLRELSRSYLAASKDLTRVMNRLKAIYRSWAIPCAGQEVYSPRHRAAWLEKLREAGVRRRAEQTYQQLDFLMGIRKETRKELLAESRKHPAHEFLEQIPRLGPIRVALLIALILTVGIVNVEPNENMEFACPSSIPPSGAQRPSSVGRRRVGSIPISSHPPVGEPCAATPARRSASLREAA
jgi:transposase